MTRKRRIENYYRNKDYIEEIDSRNAGEVRIRLMTHHEIER